MKTFFLFIIFSLTVLAQQTEIKIEDVDAQLNQTVSIPIKVKSFNDISAISLKIEYDVNSLQFMGVKNGIRTFIVNDVDGVISIGWYDGTLSNPIYIDSGVLCELEMLHKSGSSQISFITDECEITNSSGQQIQVNFINGSVNLVTGVEQEPKVPKDFRQMINFPNPFNPVTEISYRVPVSGNVSLKVFDWRGREIAELVKEYQSAGMYSTKFNANNLEIASGVYVCRLIAGDHAFYHKIVLQK